MQRARRTTATPSDRIKAAALAAIFADLASMRVAWQSFTRNAGQNVDREIEEIDRLHDSIKRWTAIWRAAR